MIRTGDESIRARLQNYRSLVLKYEAYQIVYDQLYPSATSRLSTEPRGYSEESAIDKVVQRRIDLCEKITEVLKDMRASLDEIMRMIGKLDDREQIVIIFRYVQGMSWRKIENKMNYSYKHCFRIHDRAIEKMTLNDIQKGDKIVS